MKIHSVFSKIAILLVSISLVACNGFRNDNIVIQGQLNQNIFSKIYLFKTTFEGNFLLDSTEIHQGKFSFKIKNSATYPEFYQISLSPINQMAIIAKQGDRLQITADANHLAKSYTIEGSDDAKLMHQLDRMLTQLMDTLEVLYSIYEKNIENDVIRASVDFQYISLLSQYNADLIRFIKKNSSSMVSIPAFYQTCNRRKILEEKENLDLLQLIYHDLKEKYPNSGDVKFLKNRIDQHSTTQQ